MSVVVALEPWATFWPDAAPLAEAHFAEVEGGVEPRRKNELDLDLMVILDRSGSLKLFSARDQGTMVGYLTWTLTPDVESRGLLIAMQGGWYVVPGRPRVALQLFDYSIPCLRQLGVSCLFPHHRTQGRGDALGKFFRRRGGKLIQHGYCLWIGEESEDA